MGQYIYTADWFPIINGGFDADTDWNKDPGWSIAGGVAIDVVPIHAIHQPLSLRIGYDYKVEFDLVDIVPPGPGMFRGMRARFGDTFSPTYFFPGHKIFYAHNVTQGAGIGMWFSMNIAMTSCKIDNVVATELAEQAIVNYNFTPIKGALMENTYINDTKTMTNVARVNGGTSCLIVFNPRQVE